MGQLGAIAALPERLKKAREAKGLTTRQVSEDLLGKHRMRLSHTSIAKYERGTVAPTIRALEALASVYEKPTSWFLDSGTPIGHAVFRNLPSRVSASGKRQYIASAHQWLEAYLKLEKRLGESLTAKYRVDTSGSPQEIAEAVRLRLGLGEKQPIASVIDVLEGFGVRTIEVPTELSIDGMACKFGDEFAVVLNPTTNYDRARMNAAHELGHVLLGDCDSPKLLEDADTEARAYEFASHLLLPQPVLERIFKERSLLSLLTYKVKFGVSMQAMIFRASHEPRPLLDKRTAKWLWIQFAKRGWRKHEPGRVRPDRATRFDRLLDFAISSRAVRWSEAESLLGISRGELQGRLDSAIDQCLDGEQGGERESETLKFQA